MENKHWVEELMERCETFDDLVKDQIKEQLWNYKDCSSYGCDLAYYIFEGINVDGSFTYNTYWSQELIKHYFSDFSEIVEDYKLNFGEYPCNPFEEAEKFVVIMILEKASEILSKNELVNENWNNEIELTEENIKKIIEGLGE